MMLEESKKYGRGKPDDEIKGWKGITLIEWLSISQSGKGFNIGDKVHLDIKGWREDSVSREFEIVAITGARAIFAGGLR